jgi:pSer/pThr/pTyr-binding forkhead associated (FHA) protein
VGRDHGCAVRVNSATLSRRHARIVVTNGEAAVEDLGSKNGTRVNGQRVRQPVALKEGDRIQFGSVTMTYRTLDTLPSTITRRM